MGARRRRPAAAGPLRRPRLVVRCCWRDSLLRTARRHSCRPTVPPTPPLQIWASEARGGSGAAGFSSGWCRRLLIAAIHISYFI